MSNLMRALFALILLAGVSPASSHEVKLQNLQIVHPWAHGQVSPGETAPRDVAIFMTVFNRGAVADRLISVSSPLAQSAELRDGASPVGAIVLKASDSLKMAANGQAVVLHGVTDDLAGYEAFPVWLTFERAGRVEVAVVVEDPAVKDPTCSGSLMPSEMHAHDHAHSQTQ